MTTPVSAVRPMRVGALGLLLAVLLTLLTAVPGLAHDTLTDSAPADGDSGPPPTEVVLTFSGEIASVGAAVEVSGPDGVVSEGTPAVDGVTVTQSLAASLPAGDYAVVWRVTSSDGHPISGEYGFTVDEAASTGGTDDATQTDEAEDDTASDDATSDDATGTDRATETDEAEGADVTSDDAAETGGAGAEAEDDTATSATTDAPASEDGADDDDADSGGMPLWTWAVIILALLGLGGVVLRVVRNSR